MMRRALTVLAALAIGCGGTESSSPPLDAGDAEVGPIDATIEASLDADTDSHADVGVDADADADSAESFAATDASDAWDGCWDPESGPSADASGATDGDVFACGGIICTAEQVCVMQRSEGDAFCPAWSFSACVSCDAAPSCDCGSSTCTGPFGACHADSAGHVTVQCLY